MSAAEPKIASADQVAAFVALVGDADAARSIMIDWVALVAIYDDRPDDVFMRPAKDRRTSAEEAKRLRRAQEHASGLAGLLDERTAWLVACALPKNVEGPELSWKIERRLFRAQKLLQLLAEQLDAAARNLHIERGRPMHLTKRVMLGIILHSRLADAGVTESTAEASRMVAAFRICWDIAGFTDDPRDLLRTLKARRGRNEKRMTDKGPFEI